MRAPSARLAIVALAVALVMSACSTPAEPTGELRKCDKDLDCGSHGYCTGAQLCRTDCYSDVDCLGPTTTAQCNTHGRCIDTVEPGDAAPGDAPTADDGALDGGDEDVGDEAGP